MVNCFKHVTKDLSLSLYYTCLPLSCGIGAHHDKVDGANDVKEAVVCHTHTIAIRDCGRLQFVQHLQAVS